MYGYWFFPVNYEAYEKEAGLKTTVSSDEMFQLLSLWNRYRDFNCFDNDIENVGDLEDFLRGEESAYASVIKKRITKNRM